MSAFISTCQTLSAEERTRVSDKLHMRSRRILGIYPREETMDVADTRSPRPEVAAPSYLSLTRSSYCGEIAIWLAISPHCCCIVARLMGMGSSVDSSRKIEGELRGGFRPFLHWCAAFLPFALESRIGRQRRRHCGLRRCVLQTRCGLSSSDLFRDSDRPKRGRPFVFVAKHSECAPVPRTLYPFWPW